MFLKISQTLEKVKPLLFFLTNGITKSTCRNVVLLLTTVAHETLNPTRKIHNSQVMH
jgi:hypothetical protein